MMGPCVEREGECERGADGKSGGRPASVITSEASEAAAGAKSCRPAKEPTKALAPPSSDAGAPVTRGIWRVESTDGRVGSRSNSSSLASERLHSGGPWSSESSGPGGSGCAAAGAGAPADGCAGPAGAGAGGRGSAEEGGVAGRDDRVSASKVVGRDNGPSRAAPARDRGADAEGDKGGIGRGSAGSRAAVVTARELVGAAHGSLTGSVSRMACTLVRAPSSCSANCWNSSHFALSGPG